MKLDTIQNDLNKLYSQFISIDDLIGLLEEIQPNSKKESIIHWLIHKTELLEKTKYLLFVNDCEMSSILLTINLIYLHPLMFCIN